MHEWIIDSGHTPHLVIDANAPGVEVPQGYATDGKLVVNVSLAATQGLSLGNELVTFNARFGGTPHHVSAPVTAILAIYARETGQGIVFSPEDEADAEVATDKPHENGDGPGKPAPGRPHLKVIK